MSQDKALHLSAGFFLTLFGFSIFNFIFLGIIFAFGKELYDYILKRGHPEWSDVFYTLLGCYYFLLGLILLK